MDGWMDRPYFIGPFRPRPGVQLKYFYYLGYYKVKYVFLLPTNIVKLYKNTKVITVSTYFVDHYMTNIRKNVHYVTVFQIFFINFCRSAYFADQNLFSVSIETYKWK